MSFDRISGVPVSEHDQKLTEGDPRGTHGDHVLGIMSAAWNGVGVGGRAVGLGPRFGAGEGLCVDTDTLARVAELMVTSPFVDVLGHGVGGSPHDGTTVSAAQPAVSSAAIGPVPVGDRAVAAALARFPAIARSSLRRCARTTSR